MKKLGLIGLILLSFSSINKAYADPAVIGSSITWTCVGKDSFLVKLLVYRDCNNVPLSPAPLKFTCGSTGTVITTYAKGVGTPIDITPICNSSCSRCKSSGCNFPYGIEKYTIQGIVNLSGAGSCCNINLSWLPSHRSWNITTGPEGWDYYIDAKLDRCQISCDNSPTFTNEPIEILCVGQDFTYNHGAQDIDLKATGGLADSLTYEWAEPLHSANTPISYTGSYAYNKPIYFWGFPNDALPFPRGIHLDTQTGDIQFRPMKAEVTVMVIQVNEFRNGVKIGEVKRDLQIFVIPCPTNSPPRVLTPNNIRSKTACAGTPVTFNFSTSDSNANDSVIISWNNSLPGAVWTNTNGLSKFPTATLTWTPTAAQAGSLPYNFTVTARDNACPLKAQFTQSYQITVNPKPEANIIVSDSGCGEYWFFAQRKAGSSPTYSWSGSSFTFSPMTGPLTHHRFQPGRYPYSMTMLANLCSNTYNDTLIVDPFITNDLPADTNLCYGTTFKINSQVRFNKGAITMVWGSGKNIFGSTTGLTKTLTVTTDTVIWSRASDTIVCSDADTIHIIVHKQPKVSIGPDIRICSYGQADIKAKYLIDRGTLRSISWINMKTNNIVDNDTMLSTSDSSRYICRVVDTFNCAGYDTVRVLKNPEVIASSFDQVICYGDETQLEADPTGGGSVIYMWYEGKKLIGSTKKIKVKPMVSTDYLLKVSETIAGTTCKDSTMVRVIVHQLPLIWIFPIDKRCLNGSIINLNNFVIVDGIFKTGGIWSSQSAGLINADKFNPLMAGVSSAPGWKVKYEYSDPTTGCYNKDSSYITIYALPKPYAGQDEPVCRGTKKMLAGTPSLPPGTWRGTGVGGNYPNWSFNPDTSGIVNGQTYNVIYHYTDNNKCENEDTVKFRVSPRPARPVISLTPSDSFLECNLTKGDYNWFYRTDTFINPTSIKSNSKKINPGNYCNSCFFSVVYTDTNGCVSDTSVAFRFVVNSIDQKNRSSHFIFYPNPAHSELFIENPDNETASFLMTDIFGKTVLEKKIPSGKSSISTLTYKPGVYFIFIDGIIAGKLLIE